MVLEVFNYDFILNNLNLLLFFLLLFFLLGFLLLFLLLLTFPLVLNCSFPFLPLSPFPFPLSIYWAGPAWPCTVWLRPYFSLFSFSCPLPRKVSFRVNQRSPLPSPKVYLSGQGQSFLLAPLFS